MNIVVTKTERVDGKKMISMGIGMNENEKTKNVTCYNIEAISMEIFCLNIACG